LVSLTDIPVKGVAAPEAPLDGPVHADKDKTMLAEEDKMNNTLAEADKMNKTLHADEDETMPHAPELVGREAPLDGPELAAPPSSQGRKGRERRRSTAGADEPVAAAPTEPVDAVLEPADDAVAAPEPVDPVAAPKVAAPRGRKRRRSTAASPQHGADEPVVAAPAEPVDAVLKPADDAVAAPEPVPETVDPVAGDGPDHGPGVPAPEDGGDNFDHDGGNAMLADTLADTPADTLGDAADTPLSLASMLEVLEQAKNSPSLKTHAGLGFRV
jgi:hypothetical protein